MFSVCEKRARKTSVLSRNLGYLNLKRINSFINRYGVDLPQEVTSSNAEFNKYFQLHQQVLKEHFIVLADAKRPFSRLKNIIDDRRQNFTLCNFEKYIIITSKIIRCKGK